MKKTEVTEPPILIASKQAEAGVKVKEVCCKKDILETTFYKGRKNTVGWGHPSSRNCGRWRRRIVS